MLRALTEVRGPIGVSAKMPSAPELTTNGGIPNPVPFTKTLTAAPTGAGLSHALTVPSAFRIIGEGVGDPPVNTPKLTGGGALHALPLAGRTNSAGVSAVTLSCLESNVIPF